MGWVPATSSEPSSRARPRWPRPVRASGWTASAAKCWSLHVIRRSSSRRSGRRPEVQPIGTRDAEQITLRPGTGLQGRVNLPGLGPWILPSPIVPAARINPVLTRYPCPPRAGLEVSGTAFPSLAEESRGDGDGCRGFAAMSLRGRGAGGAAARALGLSVLRHLRPLAPLKKSFHPASLRAFFRNP